MKARLQVRAGRYRGHGGFRVMGTDTKGRRVRVFVSSREAAERVRETIKAGRDVTLEDLGGMLPMLIAAARARA